MEKKINIVEFLRSLLFLLYFVILTAERLISLIAVISDNILAAGAAFDIYTVSVTVLAIIGGWGYLLIRGKKLFRLNAPKEAGDFLQPSVAAGILLLGGMVHTHGTIAPVQFAAYGCLLASMGIFCGQCISRDSKTGGGMALVRWLGFAYITAFSMSIPVVYGVNCGNPEFDLCTAHNVIEVIVSIGLTAAFTCMLYGFYKKDAVFSFSPLTVVIAVLGDGLMLVLGWHAQVNWFVLVSVCAAAVLWIIGKAATSIKKGKSSGKSI